MHKHSNTYAHSEEREAFEAFEDVVVLPSASVSVSLSDAWARAPAPQDKLQLANNGVALIQQQTEMYKTQKDQEYSKARATVESKEKQLDSAVEEGKKGPLRDLERAQARIKALAEEVRRQTGNVTDSERLATSSEVSMGVRCEMLT